MVTASSETQKTVGASRYLELCGNCTLINSFLHKNLKSPSWPRRADVLVLCFLDFVGRSLGQACFANNPLSGYLILTGIAIRKPIVAVSMLCASIVAIMFALIMQMSSGLKNGLISFNAVALGAVTSAILFGSDPIPSLGLWLLTVPLGAICTVVVSNSLGNTLNILKLPMLAVPFNLVTLTVLACAYVHQPTDDPPLSEYNQADWSMVLKGGFLGVGQIYAMQDMWCSGLTLFALFIFSPILSVAGLLGSLIASCVAMLVSPSLYSAVYVGTYGYNSFLAACAVMFFLIPTWRSVLLAGVNVLFTVALQIALTPVFESFHLPVLSLPFIGATLLVLGATADGNGLPRPR